MKESNNVNIFLKIVISSQAGPQAGPSVGTAKEGATTIGDNYSRTVQWKKQKFV